MHVPGEGFVYILYHLLLLVYSMPAAKLNMDEFWSKLHAQLQNKSHDLGDWRDCRVWDGALNRDSYGVKRVMWPGSKTSVLEQAHRVAYMVKHKVTRFNIPRVYFGSIQMDVSHRCNVKTCINPEHLILEPHTVNMERIHCLASGICSHGPDNSCLLHEQPASSRA